MGFFGGGGGGTTPVNMVGASTGTAGTAGYVPAPAAGKNTRYLSSDASFGELPLVPQNKPANTLIIKPFCHISGQNSQAYSALRRPFVPIFAPADGNINKLNFRTGTGAFSPAINFNIALWDCGEDGRPSTYLIGANQSSGTTTNTDIAVSVTSTAIKRGFYYISLTPESSMNTGNVNANGSYGFGALYSGVSSVNAVISIIGYTATTYDQTTHGTFDVTTNTVCPNVGFQYA